MRSLVGTLTFVRHSVSGCFGAAISTTGDVPRTPAPNSITLTRWVHRLSSTLASRYPHGIQARRIAQKLSASSAMVWQSPARQGTQADSCDRMQGAHRFNAQRFDWLACGLSTCGHVEPDQGRTKRDAHCACGHVVHQRPSVQSHAHAPGFARHSPISRGSTPGWQFRRTLTNRMHSAPSRFAPRLSTHQCRAPSPPPKSLGQIDVGLRRCGIVT